MSGDGIGLRSFRGIAVGSEIVARERTRELIGPEALEVASGGEVTALAVALGERVVRDLAHEGLDEGELAALGRAGVGLEDQELAPDEGAKARREFWLRDARYGRDGVEREALAENSGIAEEGSVLG